MSEFHRAVVKAKMAAYGDSNDDEIEALQEALHIACVLLHVDEAAIEQMVDGTAE